MNDSPQTSFPRLEDYEILEVLGEGGMGTVYLARDLKHERRVAIKTIRRDFVTPDVVSRFQREIKLTGALQHPRILPLFDSGVADGALYYVMQFVEGESLEERLAREGPLPIQQALRIARHVSDALDTAHSHGVVHRDIKPANIMLSGGHAFVMDFGIARALAERKTSITSTGSAIGTPTYMSPEQVSDSSAVDGRSDIYSLGCVLYEMVAGDPPFTGPTLDSILRQHLTETPRPLRVHRPGTPPEVEAVVARAMQKTPADRFQTARELADTLERISGRSQRVEAPARRHRTAFLAIAAYLAGAWGVLEIVERVAATAELPTWTVPFALVLLLIGFLVVSATAIIQATGGPAGRFGSTDPGSTGAGRGSGVSEGTPLGGLFRWRNVVAGGALALLLWGFVAAISLMRRAPEASEARGETTAASGELLPTDPERDPSERAAGTAEDGAGREPAGGPDGGREGPGAGSDTAPAADAPLSGAEPGPTAPEERPTGEPVPNRPGDPGADAAQARQEADSARAGAEAAGARQAPAPALHRADSLWAVAVDAAVEGRASAAAVAFESARDAYRDAGREAWAVLIARVDSARSGVDTLRERADPTSASYAEGEGLREEGADAQERGDLIEALAALDRASEAYAQALPAAEEPAPEAAAGEAEAGPTPPPPAERISGVMAALERAFEAEDLAGIRRIWVSLSENQVEGFREFFENGSDLDYRYEVDGGSVRVAGDAIEFRVRVRWEYTDVRGDRIRQPEFEQSFRLEESGGRDVLISS